jgi:hypothetical protein
MTVTSFCGPSDFPNVDVVDGRVVRYTKSKLTLLKYVDYGLFNFLTEDLMLIHTQTTSQVTIDLSIILNGLIEKRLLFGHEISEPYYEIGTKSGILQTEKYLKGATN